MQTTESFPQMLTVRVVRGIAHHFPIRLTEWAMLYPTIAMGWVLKNQSSMFSTSPSFSSLERIGDEMTFAAVVLICALVRFIALVVNGTFQGFGISPHLRLFASMVGLVFWSQFTLGFLESAIYGGGAWSAVVAYSTFMILELANAYRSWVDVLRTHQK